jgi:hypothetical protein
MTLWLCPLKCKHGTFIPRKHNTLRIRGHIASEGCCSTCYGYVAIHIIRRPGRVATYLREYRPFKEARAFVRGLRLRSSNEWRDYCRSGKRPHDIPSNPDKVYENEGWVGFGDWLGTGTVATFLREYRHFKEARAFVHGLGLKSEARWREYCKLEKKPEDIPTHPERVYAKTGWAGYVDWLGNDGAGKQRRN